jgi:hypothetical protein
VRNRDASPVIWRDQFAQTIANDCRQYTGVAHPATVHPRRPKTSDGSSPARRAPSRASMRAAGRRILLARIEFRTTSSTSYRMPAGAIPNFGRARTSIYAGTTSRSGVNRVRSSGQWRSQVGARCRAWPASLSAPGTLPANRPTPVPLRWRRAAPAEHAPHVDLQRRNGVLSSAATTHLKGYGRTTNASTSNPAPFGKAET